MPTLHRELTQTTRKPSSFESVDNDEKQIPPGKNIKENKVKGAGSNFIPLEKISIPLHANEDPVICKLEPFNICYRFDRDGNMHPLGARRPVRLIRIYK